MPKTREQIKHDPVSSEKWRNNRTGVMWFDPTKIKPLGNHILIALDSEPERDGVLVRPEICRNREIGTRSGTILAVGPGKWHEDRTGWQEPIPTHILLPQVFKPTTLKVGDRVTIGHFSDWESWNCSADGHESEKNIVLCQEADVRLFEPHECEIFSGDTCIECERKDPTYVRLPMD